MLGRFTMMMCSVLKMLCGFMMMVMRRMLLGHGFLLHSRCARIGECRLDRHD
jgi:hypothetical protein